MKHYLSTVSPMHWAMLVVGIALTVMGQAEYAPFLMIGAVAISSDNPGIYGSGAYPDRTGVFIPEIWSGKLLN